MKNSIRNALCTFAACLATYASSQGTFQNLDFEQAGLYVTPTPAGGWGSGIDPTTAFPGWAVGGATNGFPISTAYNTLSIGGPSVILMGPNFPNGPGYTPLQGSYSILLQFFGIGGPPTLSQTGLVPASARSISFSVGAGNVAVTLGGIDLPLLPIAGGRLAGDVTAFAGSTRQLMISTPPLGGWTYFDDIRFSSSPIPEPSALLLIDLSFAFLGYRLLGHNRRRLHEGAA